MSRDMDRLVEISNGARISYSVEGPPERPALLFINSIATTRDLWARQVPRSPAPSASSPTTPAGTASRSAPPGDYTIEQLGRDALAILDAEGARQAHVCGISLGGLTGDVAGGQRTATASREPRARQHRARIGSRGVVDRAHRARAGARHGSVAEMAMATVVLSRVPPAHEPRPSRGSSRWSKRARGGLSGMLRGAAR